MTKLRTCAVQLLLWSCLGLAASPSVARAEASLADKAAAQSLFDEGRKLMNEGKLAQACPKLAESQKLDPGVGTVFHLADCYERLGQTASAWAGFLEAASAAKSMGQGEREKVARDRAAALAPRLSKLTVTSPSAEGVAGLEIKRDGSIVGRALWGTAIPVDPGSHVIEATAPGKKPWQGTAEVKGEKANVVLTIPALDDAPPGSVAPSNVAPPPTGAAVDTATPGSGRRTLGIVVGAVGIVGLGIGVGSALHAKSKFDESLRFCTIPDDPDLCREEGVNIRNDALSAGTLATVAVGLGGAALVTGAVLILTAPSADAPKAARPFSNPADAPKAARPFSRPSASAGKPRVTVVPAVSPGWAGFVLSGTY